MRRIRPVCNPRVHYMGKNKEQTEQSSAMEGSSGTRTASPGVLVVCGPSGAGKSTLINLLMKESEGFGFSVSHTTRKPRGEEQVRIWLQWIRTYTHGICIQ